MKDNQRRAMFAKMWKQTHKSDRVIAFENKKTGAMIEITGIGRPKAIWVASYSSKTVPHRILGYGHKQKVLKMIKSGKNEL